MKKEVRLVNKIKRLLRKANTPRWLHHFGPKKYEFWQHALALFVKQSCRLSYRRTVNLLAGLGFAVPSYSALAKTNKKAYGLIEKLFYQTCIFGSIGVASIDSTGMARSNASWYYIKRINSNNPVKRPLKLSQLVDTRRKKILAIRLRAKPAHDCKDVGYMLRHVSSKPRVLVADKGYDSERIHEMCSELGIISMIPSRINTRRGFYRKKMRKCWRIRTYHRREISESLFGACKQKYGASISSRNIQAQKSDIYVRGILHNLSLVKPEIFN